MLPVVEAANLQSAPEIPGIYTAVTGVISGTLLVHDLEKISTIIELKLHDRPNLETIQLRRQSQIDYIHVCKGELPYPVAVSTNYPGCIGP